MVHKQNNIFTINNTAADNRFVNDGLIQSGNSQLILRLDVIVRMVENWNSSFVYT